MERAPGARGRAGWRLSARLPLVDCGLPAYREEARLTQCEQSVIDRGPAPRLAGERAARRSLRAQIARLERELSGILAERFPFIAVPDAPLAGTLTLPGPRLLSLAELERSRDELAGRVQSLRARAAARVGPERRASDRLEAM